MQDDRIPTSYATRYDKSRVEVQLCYEFNVFGTTVERYEQLNFFLYPCCCLVV